LIDEIQYLNLDTDLAKILNLKREGKEGRRERINTGRYRQAEECK